MKKYLLIFVMLIFAMTACNNQNKKTATDSGNEKITNDELVVVSLKDFKRNAENLVGKKVKITGTVDHVCKHGGQKMIIVSKDTDARLKIVPNENMAAFNSELEGENVMVIGIVEEQRIDENYLREWEEEVKEGEKKEKKEKLHEGNNQDNQGMEEDKSAELEQINNLRKKLNESGKDHLSFYSLVCQKYDVVIDDGSPMEN